jgi:hypothetical protein
LPKTYQRKVAAIKKSVYVNIPSKISKEIDIVKGSILFVALEGERVVLSKDQNKKGVVANQTPELEGKQVNGTKCEDSLKRMLENGYTW